MPCNSCIPPPPIFDIPPPPDPSLVLHLLIDDIKEVIVHSSRQQFFHSCLIPPFSLFSKLHFGDWLLPFLAIFIFCIFTIIVGLLAILIRKIRRKREIRTTTRNRNDGGMRKKLNRKSNSFVSSPASFTAFQMPESDSSSPSNFSSSSSAFSSVSPQHLNKQKYFHPISSTETMASLTYSLNKQQINKNKSKRCWLLHSNTFSLSHPFNNNIKQINYRCKLPLPPSLPKNNIPVPSFNSKTKSSPKSVAFHFNNNSFNETLPQQFISWKTEKKNKLNNPSCCYGSSEIYEELATDYQENIAEPPYLKRLSNQQSINRLPPPISRPPPLPPEQFNNFEKEIKIESKTESGYGTGKSGREEIKQKINNFSKRENIKNKSPINNNENILSPPNIWTSSTKEEENNEYIYRQQRTYV
ncbi:hypothetical protein ACQ4LE_007213 [Meloidogyne hapla]|uniref:Uncharacterized protein n=1 Tax=Meloidogyne hapla TaxID=6305 RepID=A0A1I8BET0_MELHA